MKSVTDWFKKLSSSDNRKARRLKSSVLVAYYWDGAAPMAHEVKNISSTGFYLSTKERWHPGTVVTMTLQRTDIADENSSAERHISVLSKVVRLADDGVGFAFVPLEDRGSSQAKDLISRPAGKKAIGRFLDQLELGDVSRGD